jgi:hypothetical protein
VRASAAHARLVLKLRAQAGRPLTGGVRKARRLVRERLSHLYQSACKQCLHQQRGPGERPYADPAVQISKRSCFPEAARLRRSPSVPRGPPQWRHLIGVDEGASSAHSNTMPRPSQTLQTISNLPCDSDVDRCVRALLRASIKQAAGRSMIA